MLLLTGLLASGSTNPPSEPVDLEMLEFLGGFETGNGNWLDPLTFDEAERKPTREDKQHE